MLIELELITLNISDEWQKGQQLPHQMGGRLRNGLACHTLILAPVPGECFPWQLAARGF